MPVVHQWQLYEDEQDAYNSYVPPQRHQTELILSLQLLATLDLHDQEGWTRLNDWTSVKCARVIGAHLKEEWPMALDGQEVDANVTVEDLEVEEGAD